MQINLYSRLRNIAGQSSLFYAIGENLSLLDVLILLVDEYPAFKDIFFDQDGVLSAQMPIFLNGRNPRLLPDGLYTQISQTDVLSLFTPLASGKMNVEALKQAQNGGDS